MKKEQPAPDKLLVEALKGLLSVMREQGFMARAIPAIVEAEEALLAYSNTPESAEGKHRYFPGNYSNICVKCKKQFYWTDKMCFMCSDCMDKSKPESPKGGKPEEIRHKEFSMSNDSIFTDPILEYPSQLIKNYVEVQDNYNRLLDDYHTTWVQLQQLKDCLREFVRVNSGFHHAQEMIDVLAWGQSLLNK